MGFPQITPGGGGGLTNAYAFITDGTNTASAAGSDTIDFVSPDGTILFTVVPGSPGTVQAKAVQRPKRLLYSAGAFSNVNSIVTSGSLIGGAQTILPASTLTVGDVFHMHAIGAINNSSGVSANVFVNFLFAGQSDGNQSAKAMATGSNGNWNLDIWGVIISAAGLVFRMNAVSNTNWLSPTTNAPVVANSSVNPPGAMFSALLSYNVPLTFDVIGNTTVNNANMGFTVLGVAVERFAVGV